MESLQKRPLTFVLFLLRLLSGVVGGVAGTLALFVVYFLLLHLVPETEGVNSLSFFVIVVMAFVGTLVSNTVVSVMVTFMDNAKYARRKTTILHVFLFNLILFFLTIPLYLLALQLDIMIAVVAVHLLLSAFISALIMELLAGERYALMGLYSLAFGIFFAITLAVTLVTAQVRSLIIIFSAMPGVWFLLQLFGGLTELIYDNFVKFYGVDALNTQTDLGGDSDDESEEN
ncbi:hypothetical protein IPJ72_00130 [Candidatus Peregrinibacteria bacterium]|nr:MAG: hypothetical protein IPJ72_00130 [Candidatus Peregrinibacteria bacterium]